MKHSGTYTFPDKSSVSVIFYPHKSDASKEVYVEYYIGEVKYGVYLPPQGLRYKG